MSGQWTDEAIAFAIEKWKEGKSMGQIANLISASFSVRPTRSAVIGKLNRLGFKRGHPSAPMKAKVEATAPKTPRPSSARPPVAVAEVMQPSAVEAARVHAENIAKGQAALVRAGKIDVESPNARPFLDARRGCKWPIGEGMAMMSCCNPIHQGSYCRGHAAIGYAPNSGAQRTRTERTASHLTRHDRTQRTPRPANDSGGLWDAVA